MFRCSNDGAQPYGWLVLANSPLYGTSLFGTTQNGGAYGKGTIFALALPVYTEYVAHAFGLAGDGAYPYAGLINVGGTPRPPAAAYSALRLAASAPHSR